MKKFLENLKNEKVIHYIFIVLATIIAGIPLINLRIYGTDDGFIHVLRVMGVDKILQSGTFPPFISSVFCNGFGYAINVFYPPIVTYGPLFFKLFCTHYYDALKIYTYLTILISSISMYHLVREVSNKREIALVAAIIYTFIPYKLETIYNRFAIGEFSAYMFIPLVFLGLHNLLYGDKKKHYFITIGAVGLMLTHTLSTEYTAMFALIYLIANCNKLKNKEVLKKIVINVVFILLISAFFLLPLLEYKNHSDYIMFSSISMSNRGSDVAGRTISFKQLFKDTEEPEGVCFNLGILFPIMMILGIFTYRKMSKEDKNVYLSFLIIALISLFMTSKFFPWAIMPDFISKLQFPWRMLEFFEFSMAILCAYNVITLIENISKKEWISGTFLLGSIVIIIIGMAKVNYNYKYEAKKTLNDLEYEQRVNSRDTLEVYSINRDYLPYTEENNKVANHITEKEQKTFVLSGDAVIEEDKKYGLTVYCKLKDAKEGTILELPIINYPGYTITLKSDNDEQKILYTQSEYGLIQIKIPYDVTEGKLQAQYTGTLLEKISYIISAISAVLFVVYLAYTKRNIKAEK